MRRSRNGGYILVTVLGVMLTVTGLIASASVYTHTILRSVKADGDDAAMTGLVTAGVELTAYQLFVLKLPLTAVNGRRMRLAGATIEPVISDEAGKIDVNAANVAVLESAFRSAGLTQGEIADLLQRIQVWRGTSIAPGPAGSLSAPPGPPVKHTPFRSVEDFMAFAAVGAARATALAPLLTVYNISGTVNILTASPRVLMALPGLTSVAVSDFIAQRARADITNNADRDRLMSALQNQRAFISTADGPVYRVDIEAVARQERVSRGVAYIAKSAFAADPYLILQWGS